MSAGHPHPDHPPHPPHPPRGIQEAWDGHFEAFNAKDLEKIIQDYDEDSVITTYNQASGIKNVHEGVEGARSLFTGLFTVVSDMGDMVTLALDLDAESRTGFFVWRCPTWGFQDGTDTFVFGPNNKIHRQTAVVRTG